MNKPELEGNRLGHPETSYADRLAAKGTPGSTAAADKRVHERGIPCPADRDRYLSTDEHMWLPLHPDLDLQKVGVVLTRAFPPRSYR